MLFILLHRIIRGRNAKLFMKVAGEIALRTEACHGGNLVHLVITGCQELGGFL